MVKCEQHKICRFSHGTVQWREEHSHCCTAVTAVSRTFPSCKTETLPPLNTKSLLPTLLAPGSHRSPLCPYEFGCSRDRGLMQRLSSGVRRPARGAGCSGFIAVGPVSAFPSRLRPCSVLLRVRSTACLSGHPMTAAWAVSTCRLLSVVLL